MSTWGAGPFENDDALDWLSEFRVEGILAAGAAIADVLALEAEFLEAPIAARAVAAAEVIAAASGRPGPNLPNELTDWLKAHEANQGPELRRNATTAVNRVLDQSELRDLWAESDEFDVWATTLRDISSRLR